MSSRARHSKAKRPSTSSVSSKDYETAEEDLEGLRGAKEPRREAGDRPFDAYVHEGDESSAIFVTMMEQAGARLSAGQARTRLESPASISVAKVRNFVKRKMRDIAVPSRSPEAQSAGKLQFRENVMDGLQLYLEEPLCLHKALVASEYVQKDKSSDQESLVKMLLQCEDLQTCLVKTLMEKMVEVSSVTGSQMILDAIEAAVGVRVNVSQLILQQLQGLSTVVDGPALVEIMKEHFEYLNQADQKQVIVAAPFILRDSDHEEMAVYFLSVLEKEALKKEYLTIPILDSLSNFLLTPSMIAETEAKVFSIIPSMAFQDIPAAVKFLMESVNGNETTLAAVEQMVKKLRDCLDLDSDFDVDRISTSRLRTQPGFSITEVSQRQASGRQRRRSEEANRKSSVALVVDALLNGIRIERIVWQAWNQLILSLSIRDRRPSAVDLDFIVILLLLHHEPSRKLAEVTLKKCVKNGFLTPAVVEAVFKRHSDVLRPFCKALQNCIHALLFCANQDQRILAFLATLVSAIFSSFDQSSRQDVVGSLVVAIGNGSDQQKDSAMDILIHLVARDVDKVSPFIVMIKSLLDYLDAFSLSLARKLFSVIGTMASPTSSGDGVGDRGLDDIFIIIRKQLSSNEFHRKSLAIVGAVSLIWHDTEFEDSTKKLLEMVMASCWTDPRAFALLCDELSMTLKFETAMTLIDNKRGDGDHGVGTSTTKSTEKETRRKLIEYLHDRIVELFQNEYCADEDNTKSKEGETASTKAAPSIKTNLCYKVPNFGENELDAEIHIPIVDMILKGFSALKGRLPVHPLLFSPLLRLLCLLETRRRGKLEDIDGVLICPTALPAESVHDQFEDLDADRKSLVLDSWFLCASWFRELLNGFAVDDETTKTALGHRLRALTHLDMLIRRGLTAHHKFEAPVAAFDVVEERLKAPKLSAVGGAGKGKGKKSTKTAKKMTKRKRKNELENEETNDDDNNFDEDVDNNAEKPKSAVVVIDLSHYKAAFREFDIEVFSMLHRKCDLREGQKERAAEDAYLVLKPKELLYLLDDLVAKLAFKLSSSTVSFPGKDTTTPSFHRNLETAAADKVWKKVVKLTPFICNHLEDIATYYQEPASKSTSNSRKGDGNVMNDSLFTQTGFVDSADKFTDDGLVIRRCYKHLLFCLTSIFGWSQSSSSSNRPLLQEAFDSLCIKMSSAFAVGSTQQKNAEALEMSFRYFTNYAESVPSIECAVELIKTLKHLAGFAKKQSLKSKLDEKTSALCREFLLKEWIGPDQKKIKGVRLKDVEFLVDNYIRLSADDIAMIEEVTTQGLGDVISSLGTQAKDDASEAASKSFLSIDKNSFPGVFRVILRSLAAFVKDIHVRFNEGDISVDELIEEWIMATRLLQQNLSFLRSFDPRRIAVPCIREGNDFVETFLKHTIPLFETVFRDKGQEIMGLFKTFQQCTRVLNHLCGHSKMYREVTLLKYVPKMKKKLETFVCRVKALLAKNRCSEAFWMGNLKNRNLQGEEILSQASTVVSEDSTNQRDNEEDLPDLIRKRDGDDGDEEEDDGEEEEEEEEEEEDREEDEEEGETKQETHSLSDVF